MNMRIIEVQFTPLSKSYWFDPAGHDLKVEDYVIVKTNLGIEIGKVLGFKEISDEEKSGKDIKPVLRKANLSDIEKNEGRNKHKAEALKIGRELVDKHNLDMKITDVHYSFDGSRITFYFTAAGRIDFRELVKNLTHYFQKSIRLHQIGVRDEAKRYGEFGPCGRFLCCKKFLDKLGQISSDFAEVQQIAHRGSERITGVCGRLKCCLAYEEALYEELNRNLPSLDSVIKTPQGKGKVVAVQTLKQTVRVALEEEPKTIVEVKV